MPLAILHVVASIDPAHGGVSVGVANYQRIGRERGHKVDIVTLDAPDEPFLEALDTTYALGRRRPAWMRFLPWYRYGYQKAFASWLRENAPNYDIVVVNGLWNYAAMGARLALANSSVPYVVFTHGMLDPWFKRTYPVKSLLKQLFWWFCEGPLLDNARLVLFTSDEEMELARHSFRPYRARGRVVGFGAEDAPEAAARQIDAFRKLAPALDGRRYLLFLSRIHPKKGCDLLLSAFAMIAATYPDLDLVMAGPDQVGWCAELQRQAHESGLAARVHWLGMLSGDEKWGAFRAAEAFVLPSHQENFGVVVAEAMASETPVLTTTKVNIWREVESAGAGLVDEDSAAGIERLLTRFLQLAPQTRAAMRKAARAGFLANFQIEQASTAFEAALADALAEGLNRPPS